MKETVSFLATFPIVLIMDPDAPAEAIPDARIPYAATDSCIAVACTSYVDGETTCTLGDARDVDNGTEPLVDQTLRTPGRVLALITGENKTLAKVSVPRADLRVRVWTNDPRIPNEVIVGFE